MAVIIPRSRLVFANTFSPNMLNLAPDQQVKLRIRRVSLKDVIDLLNYCKISRIGVASVIGHESTAKLIETLTGYKVPVNRINYKISKDETLIVVTLGFRPPEGRIYNYDELLELYKEGKIAFYVVELEI